MNWSQLLASPFVRRPRTEYGILRSVSLWVPTDEQIEKGKRNAAEKGYTFKTTLSIRTEVEPLSYRFDGGTLGNISLKYLPVTYALDDDDLAGAREGGLAGVTPSRIITASLRGGPLDEKNEFPRWLKYLNAAGYDLDLDDAGQPVIPGAVGRTFRMQEGEDVFPSAKRNPKTGKWDERDAEGKPYTFTKSNLQYLIEDVTDSYVQDPDKVRVIAVRARDENTEEAAVSAMSGAGLDVSAALRQAVLASGLVGRNANEFKTARAALSFCEGAIGVAPILVGDDVNEAAASGNFIEYLTAQGAIVVGDDGSIMGKE